MGDAVNTTARLSSLATAGEILVPVAAAAKAHVDPTGLEHRSVDLKGKTRSTEIIVFTVGPASPRRDA